MKTNLGEIAKAYMGSATFFMIAGEGVMFGLERYGYVRQADYVLPALAAFTVPALPFGIYLADRVGRLARPPASTRPNPAAVARQINMTVNGEERGIFASAAAWVVGPGRSVGHSWGLGEEQGRTMKYKAEAQPEFIFWEKGMSSLITELRLLNFCRIAWRRQRQVEFGDLRANQVFSRGWFTKNARPRWPLPDYESCLYIISSKGLVINRWQGKGGSLLYPPHITVEEAKKRWSG